jgi:DNA repair exonuclease SbcCD ATPase subunit
VRAARRWQTYQDQKAHHEKTIGETRAKIASLETEAGAVDKLWRPTLLALIELEYTERVLGLRGVRAPLLAGSLSGIEAVANAWLARLGRAGLRVVLHPYSEKKSGGVVDAISLDVAGAGGGYGYKASSGGERRRIDVALMLALAEVAAAAHGHLQGTMFFDEVFDQLDVGGLDSLAEALQELAQDRCVVVITHSEILVDRVPWARHFHVSNGVVTDARSQ